MANANVYYKVNFVYLKLRIHFFTMSLALAKGKLAPFTVQPLPDAPAPPPIPAFASEDEARTYWMRRRDEGASPDELAAIQAAAPTTPAQNEDN